MIPKSMSSTRSGCVLVFGQDDAPKKSRLSRHQPQRLVDRAQHAVELVSPLDDEARRRDHAVDALLAREFWIFFDSVERDFGGTAEDRKNRAVSQEIDRVITPFAGCDHAAVQAENAVELAAAESDLAGDGACSAGLAPALLARIGFAESHAAPPCLRCVQKE